MPEYNKKGKIQAPQFLDALLANHITDVDLILELSFRERQPQDSSVEYTLTESVKYWNHALDNIST